MQKVGAYLKSSGKQIVLGNYTDDVTVLGTAGQIGSGLLGVDLPGDVRDLTYDITHWEWSWSHAGQTTIDVMALIPVVGSLKYTDEIGTLVKNSDEAIAGLKGAGKASSKVLRQNLIDAGIEVPDYANAAHHIVAGTSQKANEARAILQKYGIDINDASNGVFLPTANGVSNSAYHPGLHTNTYYNKVNDMLRGATSKNDVLDILDDIADQLSNGTFMK